MDYWLLLEDRLDAEAEHVPSVLENATKWVRANGRGGHLCSWWLNNQNHFHDKRRSNCCQHDSDSSLTPLHCCDRLTHCPENDSCKCCYETWRVWIPWNKYDSNMHTNNCVEQQEPRCQRHCHLEQNVKTWIQHLVSLLLQYLVQIFQNHLYTCFPIYCTGLTMEMTWSWGGIYCP